MHLDKILEQWQKDSEIDLTNLVEVSRNTPRLHAKYLQMLTTAKLQLREAEFMQKDILKKKWLWYNGKMSQKQIESLGWDYDAMDGLKVMKGEMNYFYDADEQLQDAQRIVDYKKTIVDALTDIMESIKWRHQHVNNIIKWKVFESGG